MRKQRRASHQQLISESHTTVRTVLRVVGPLALVTGLGFMAVGVISFFSAFGSLGSPRYFWCCFVGLPLIVAGLATTSAGFAGAILRYQASEMAPVGVDTLNYVAEGTQDGVQTVVGAVVAGLRDGVDGPAVVACHACAAENEADSKFCDQCGVRVV